MTLKKKNQKGFTIIELMIATTVFSFILLVTSVGVIAIGRAYYKSVTSTRVQETARSIINDVSGSLQFSNKEAISRFPADGIPSEIKARCFGSDRYTYVLNQRVEDGVHALYRDTRSSEAESTCEPGDFTGGTELLGDNMRLLQFEVSNADPFRVVIRIAYGDNDLLTIYDDTGSPVGWNDPVDPPEEPVIAGALCKFALAGNEFCAVAGLETTVTSRVE
ncbi:MAG TPA: prepilin-type N-terminal cleavage/methylation domain-containing protein [Candidatus Saccharimonadales bacterium]|nr:prepilin-type N-terminal cleavage/methylation domain-containing protein [Candidatus Saccharimonadales bacterium]